MGWFEKILGGTVAEPIEAIGNVVDKVFTSDDERLTHEEVLTRLKQKPGLAQAEISKVEAQHRSVFVAGARPAILWVCALGLFFCYLVNPILQWSTGEPGPILPLESMTELVAALLGLGALRTVEKIAGRAK